ncbi:MAG: hypothetical protein KKB51_06400 [Candidatus Riflebacteria bacterium]|nr:hypothetical protein [Candidatus Riflebacteria bacterium]
MSLEIFKEAIEKKLVVSFEYNIPGKSNGLRIGNPHAIFEAEKKDGSKSIQMHFVQTDGVSDSSKPFPSFRMFSFKDVSNAQICLPNKKFTVSKDYNPNWDGYKKAIVKI